MPQLARDFNFQTHESYIRESACMFVNKKGRWIPRRKKAEMIVVKGHKKRERENIERAGE